ncbi:MAG: UDP-N-acetylglucosamine 1-carboxyvinyltransferase [Planctomycetota bacterium]|jgi:UDP-N-acetylglucosamine 1-carboxyvinyltransferase
MTKLVIKGPTNLKGQVSVRGAKNAALPIILASAVSTQPVTLRNVPTELKDVCVALESLRYIDCKFDIDDDQVKIHSSEINETSIPTEFSGQFRSSLLFLSILTGRCGHAKITMPGGCDLGDRKFDLHLEGLRLLGAKVEVSENSIEVWADQLIGTDIDFYLPTTTGTENIMIAACFAKGRTRIFNANTRPEIADLGQFLNSLGANVSVRNRIVEVEGVANFTAGQYRIMPGWDEALMYMIAAGMTNGEICVKDFTIEHIRGDIGYLKEAGLDVFEWGGNVYVSGKERNLHSFNLFTAPYPGVNSDMQPLFAALASQCIGESMITDQRFTERFAYVNELKKLGVKIDNYGNCAVVKGPNKLKGNKVNALDLRCGAALVISALTAEGTTEIENSYQIYRGHEHIVSRLKNLGADVAEI